MLRHARSPQRVCEASCTMRKNAQRERSDTHDPRRGCAGTNPHAQKFAQRERSDTHDPRRGRAGAHLNAQKRTAGALRHARSPQRARGRTSKCTKTHSGSAPTRTIPAEGCIALGDGRLTFFSPKNPSLKLSGKNDFAASTQGSALMPEMAVVCQPALKHVSKIASSKNCQAGISSVERRPMP